MAKAKRRYCDAWDCPSLWTCEKAWGRAKEYWAFDVDALERIEFFKGPRNRLWDACHEYERATAKDWLKDAFTPTGPHQLPPPRGVPLRLV